MKLVLALLVFSASLANACSEKNIRELLYLEASIAAVYTIAKVDISMGTFNFKTAVEMKDHVTKVTERLDKNVDFNSKKIDDIVKKDQSCHIGKLTSEFQNQKESK